MINKKLKWLIYTVLVGLIPIISRLFIAAIINKDDVNYIVPSDFIALGLVLHISIINELEHLENNNDWKTIQNGLSICFIAIYSVLFSLVVFNEEITSTINNHALIISSCFLVFASLVISFSVFHRLNIIFQRKISA